MVVNQLVQLLSILLLKCGNFVAATDEKVGEGDRVALQMAFNLPSSTYATMLVRELTKTSTATAFHKSLTQLVR